ncbi:MAG: small basic protein [Planctomycetota bacterium]|nr:small basic protein [Planctomycetota bacterium]
MSIHRTLRNSGALKGTRNVLSRYERIVQLEAEGRFIEGDDDPFGLPKTRVLKVKKRAKAKKEKEDVEAEGEEGVDAEEGQDQEKDRG